MDIYCCLDCGFWFEVHIIKLSDIGKEPISFCPVCGGRELKVEVA